MIKMPSHYLWTGEARKAFMAMSMAQSYQDVRHNDAAKLVAGETYSSVCFLGAGPDPTSERTVLDGMQCDSVYVHDVSLQYARDLREQFDRHKTRLVSISWDITGPDVPVPGMDIPKDGFDLAAFLGYGIGNLDCDPLIAFLETLPSKHLLLDLPLACATDPRLRGDGLAPNDVEVAWFETAYRSYAGSDLVVIDQKNDQVCKLKAKISNWLGPKSCPEAYLITYQNNTVELVRFYRRSLAIWIRTFDACGWDMIRCRTQRGIMDTAVVLLRKR